MGKSSNNPLSKRLDVSFTPGSLIARFPQNLTALEMQCLLAELEDLASWEAIHDNWLLDLCSLNDLQPSFEKALDAFIDKLIASGRNVRVLKRTGSLPGNESFKTINHRKESRVLCQN